MREGVSEATSPRDTGSSAGFTLMELILVMVLMGVIMAAVAPRFFASSDFDVRGFRHHTLAALRYAQKLAVATGCQVQVTIASNTFTLNLQDGCTGSVFTQAVTHPGTGAATYSRTAPRNVTLSSSVAPLIFNAAGRALDSGGTVSDATVSIGSLQLGVVGETGFVREL